MRERQRRELPKRRVPSIREWVQMLIDLPGFAGMAHETAVQLARQAAQAFRAGEAQTAAEALEQVVSPLQVCGPQAVINATGIMLHTNLGRAPLDREVVLKALDRVAGFTDLEMNLVTGKRGQRDRHFSALAQLVWDTDDALIVNNAAAAIALSLAALAAGKETLVSRGELIEIGGSFRLPDVMNFAGTRLREVGTTNKTKLSDFSSAIGSETACLFKTHLSNYRIEGFTHSVSLAELAKLGQAHHLPVIMDLGSGHTRFLPDLPGGEPTVENNLAQGADLVIFSGDKLFGAVQAGIVLGKQRYLEQMRRHPMMRMVRADKLTIAIVCQHLADLVRGQKMPLHHMTEMGQSTLIQRAEEIRHQLNHPSVSVVPEPGFIGGGSLPGQEMESAALVVACPKPDRLAKNLRMGHPSIVPYIREGALRLNLVTVFPSQDAQLVEALSNLRQDF